MDADPADHAELLALGQLVRLSSRTEYLAREIVSLSISVFVPGHDTVGSIFAGMRINELRSRFKAISFDLSNSWVRIVPEEFDDWAKAAENWLAKAESAMRLRDAVMHRHRVNVRMNFTEDGPGELGPHLERSRPTNRLEPAGDKLEAAIDALDALQVPALAVMKSAGGWHKNVHYNINPLDE